MNNTLRKNSFSKFFGSLGHWVSGAPILVLLSAALLILAYPQTNLWLLSWIGLVPLMTVIDARSPLKAFGCGYLCGVIFFAATLYWFIYVTTLGAVLLVLYLSLYFGCFAFGYALVRERSFWIRLIFVPSLWVVLEYIRGHFLTGFGWVNLGHSQQHCLPVIQMAELTGVYGISFLLVLVNFVIRQGVRFWTEKTDEAREHFLQGAAVTAVALAVVIVFGVFRLAVFDRAGREWQVAVIQPDVAQEMKWSRSAWPRTMEHLLALTKEAAKGKPDIIIWPETSLPGYVWEAPELLEELKDYAARLEIPMVIGLVTRPQEDVYYNSAILLSAEGKITEQYNKLHLVPFGEYIPLRGMFPFLEEIVPIADFTAGDQATVFSAPSVEINGRHKSFSMLICFEDTIARVTRKFARAGAELLVNITNDAWFADTKAPYLHLQSAVFRAVENRRFLVRAANTGVSCFINAAGRVTGYAHDSRGKRTFVPAVAQQAVDFHARPTFYTLYGDVFAWLCFGTVLVAGILEPTAHPARPAALRRKPRAGEEQSDAGSR